MPSLQVHGGLTKRRGAVRQRPPLMFRLLHEVGTFHSIIRNYRGGSQSARYRFDNCRYREKSRETSRVRLRARGNTKNYSPLREITAVTIDDTSNSRVFNETKILNAVIRPLYIFQAVAFAEEDLEERLAKSEILDVEIITAYSRLVQ